MNVAGAPPLRQMTAMVWDDADGETLLFGGRVAGVGAANDLWALAPTSALPFPTFTPTPTATMPTTVTTQVNARER